MRFENYDEKEEATCIKKITLLRFSPISAYVVCGLISLATGFIFALFLYWKIDLQIKFFYGRVGHAEDATHVLVEGATGNREIVRLTSSRADGKNNTFIYRFIKFELDVFSNTFKPVIFDIHMTH